MQCERCMKMTKDLGLDNLILICGAGGCNGVKENQKPEAKGSAELICSVAIVLGAGDRDDVDGVGNTVYKCPKCEGTDIFSWYSYCPNCGGNLKFEL